MKQNIKKSLNIRTLHPEDLSLWKNIRLEALKAHPEAFGSSYKEESIFSDDDFKNGLLESDIFGAFVNDDLIGTSGFSKYTYLKMQHRGSLFGMYVKPKYRAQGVASRLIQAVLSHASQKVMQLHCRVATENDVATQLYIKEGFVNYGTEPRSLKVNDKFYDEHLMILKF